MISIKEHAGESGMPKKDTKPEKLSGTIHITVEEMKNLGIEGLDQMFMEIYTEQVCQPTDSRRKYKIFIFSPNYNQSRKLS